jgi:lipid A ethanolaminephosphotransferase
VVTLQPIFTTHPKLLALPPDIARGQTYADWSQPRMLLLLLFVGETTRGDHFSLNGYARQDSPELATRDVTSWTNCRQPG